MILLAVVAIVAAGISTSLAMFCYRKRLRRKAKNKKQVGLLLTLASDDQPPQTATLIPEPDSPTGKGPPVRTLSYAVPSRRRISSSGSVASNSPLVRYNRNGSYRSRLSSTVSSRLDSNISEGKTLTGLHHE